MSRTNLETDVFYDNAVNNTDVAYDVRSIFSLATTLATPVYFLLALAAVTSRCSGILRALASHGKTYMNDSTNKRITLWYNILSPSSSWSPWCWVSKRCFVHFYLVGLLSTTIATVYYLDFHHQNMQHHHSNERTIEEISVSRMAGVFLLVIHMFRRVYECLYVQQYREESSKMHIAGYALGVVHYMLLPLVFWEIDTTNNSNIVIESDNNRKNEDHSSGSESISSKMTIRVWVFIVAMIGINIWLQYEQHIHHVILADIRRVTVTKKKKQDGTKHEDKSSLRQNQHYSLPPYRRWFRYVLSPHYLAEILLYLSFAIILEIAASSTVRNDSVCKNISGNFTSLFYFGKMVDYLFLGRRYRHWMLFVWVATNLTVSALNSYDWYSSMYKNSNRISNSLTTDAASHRHVKNVYDRKALFPKIL